MSISDIMNSFKEFEEQNQKVPQVTILDAYNNLEWYMNRMKQHGKLGYDSKFIEIDKYTSGIIPGKVYTIAAYSNTGKSRLAYDYASYFTKQGKKVLFFSLEVDSGMVLKYLLLNYYNINTKELLSGYEINLGDFENCRIFDNVYDLETIGRTIEYYEPDIVFIDFIQNITTDGKSEYEKMSKIAKKVQQFAISNKCSIFSLSQLANDTAKEVSRGNTDFVSLKGAGELFASSDVIFLMRRMNDDYGNPIIGIKIIKNKYGKVGEEFQYDVDFERSNFIYKSNTTF